MVVSPYRRKAANCTRWLRGVASETVTVWSPGCVCRIDAIVPGRTTKQQWQQGALLCMYAPEGRHRTMTLIPVEEGELVLDERSLMTRERVAEIAAVYKG
jgi:hypothetical protein